jgi:hypothetical protein
MFPAQAAAHIETAQAWQHQIEDQQVRPLTLDQLHGLKAIVGLEDTESLALEVIGDQRRDIVLIVHHEDLHAAASTLSDPPPFPKLMIPAFTEAGKRFPPAVAPNAIPLDQTSGV